MHLASPTRPAHVAVSSDIMKKEFFSILLKLLELGMNEQTIIERLKKVSLFRGLADDPERLAKLARIVSWRECRTGDQVIREAEEGSELYILNRGVVNVVKRTLAEETYTIVTLREDEDAFFGELALMDREVRSASVVATSDCDFLVITREDFLRLGDEDPWLGLLVTRAIGGVLARRLRKTSEDMVMLFEALVGQPGGTAISTISRRRLVHIAG